MPAHPIGHNPPVGVWFQFLLVERPVIDLSGWYSAIKLIAVRIEQQPASIQDLMHCSRVELWGLNILSSSSTLPDSSAR